MRRWDYEDVGIGMREGDWEKGYGNGDKGRRL